MKSFTLAATFVVLAASFAAPGFAADGDGAKVHAPAEITFVSKTATQNPHISHAVYLTDATASGQRNQNLLVDVSGRHFKKKFLKRKSFSRNFSHHRGIGHSGFKRRNFGHRSFGHSGFGHRNFGHGGFGHHRGDFGHGGKVIKKGLFGKLFFGH